MELQNILNRANLLLNRAEEELNKPQEDVVSLSICQGTKESLDLYLKAFLLRHEAADIDAGSMVDRLERCRVFDKRFDSIDLQTLECVEGHSCHMNQYCLSINKVSECLAVAKLVRAQVHGE